MSANRQNYSSGPFPKGKIPMEEAFRIMWTHIAELKGKVDSQNEINENFTSQISHLSSLSNENPNLDIKEQVNVVPSNNNNLMEKVMEQDKKITLLTNEIKTLGDKFNEVTRNMDRTIENIGTDMTDMNTKYQQMNNFLVEIQTTQITVNNQILRHYNENIESQVEKNVSEKFLNYKTELKNSQTNNTVSSNSVDGETDSVVTHVASTDDVAVATVENDGVTKDNTATDGVATDDVATDDVATDVATDGVASETLISVASPVHDSTSNGEELNNKLETTAAEVKKEGNKITFNIS